jgi:hypothetical protein
MTIQLQFELNHGQSFHFLFVSGSWETTLAGQSFHIGCY